MCLLAYVVCVYVYVHICFYTCICVCMHANVCMQVDVCTYLWPVSLSVSVCLHICFFLLFCMQRSIMRLRTEFANRVLDIHNFQTCIEHMLRRKYARLMFFVNLLKLYSNVEFDRKQCLCQLLFNCSLKIPKTHFAPSLFDSFINLQSKFLEQVMSILGNENNFEINIFDDIIINLNSETDQRNTKNKKM